MKRWKVLLLCVFVFLFGIALTLFWVFMQGSKVPTKWFVFDSLKHLNLDGKYVKEMISYSTESLFDADIQLPEIKRVELNAKFKDLAAQQVHIFKVGYVLKITIDKLDKKKVPEKYLIRREEKYKSGTWTTEPLDEVTYEIKFEIIFKDSDGFEIYRTKPIETTVRSGMTNVFQNLAPDPIPRALIKKTKYFEPRINLSKCISCQPD